MAREAQAWFGLSSNYPQRKKTVMVAVLVLPPWVCQCWPLLTVTLCTPGSAHTRYKIQRSSSVRQTRGSWNMMGLGFPSPEYPQGPLQQRKLRNWYPRRSPHGTLVPQSPSILVFHRCQQKINIGLTAMWQRVRSCREAARAALLGDGRIVSEFTKGCRAKRCPSTILNEFENIVTPAQNLHMHHITGAFRSNTSSYPLRGKKVWILVGMMAEASLRSSWSDSRINPWK